MDPTEFGAGSAAIDVSYAVKHSGGHDLWDAPAVEEIPPDGLETVRKRPIKVRYPYLRKRSRHEHGIDRNPTLATRAT